MANCIDLSGKKFGRLTVLQQAGKLRPVNRKGTVTTWLCVCDCGNERLVRTGNLLSGNTRSCGCLHSESVAEARRKEKTQNEYEIFGSVAVVKTSCGKSFIIDAEDLPKIQNVKCWVDEKGYVRGQSENWKSSFLHRTIMGCDGKMVVDHINHNTLDNRKSNLRLCYRKDNAKNRKLSCKNKSGFTGVCYSHRINKWIASITVDYRRMHLGSFETKEEAIEARKQAEILYFKDYRFGYNPNDN